MKRDELSQLKFPVVGTGRYSWAAIVVGEIGVRVGFVLQKGTVRYPLLVVGVQAKTV